MKFSLITLTAAAILSATSSLACRVRHYYCYKSSSPRSRNEAKVRLHQHYLDTDEYFLDIENTYWYCSPPEVSGDLPYLVYVKKCESRCVRRFRMFGEDRCKEDKIVKEKEYYPVEHEDSI